MIEPCGWPLSGTMSLCRLAVSRLGLTSPPAPFRVGVAPTDSFSPKIESSSSMRARSAASDAIAQRRDEFANPGGILAEQARRWRRSGRRPSPHRAGTGRDGRPADWPTPTAASPQAAPITSPPSAPDDIAARQVAGIEQRRGARDHHAAEQAEMQAQERAVMRPRPQSRPRTAPPPPGRGSRILASTRVLAIFFMAKA